MKRLFVILLGASAGFLLAAELPMWPLLYGDIGRNAPLWHAYDFPNYERERWAMPLCVMATLIAGGEIGVRRFHQWLRRRRKQSADETGRCATCGYNLTGNASGVCPECGTPVAQKIASLHKNPPST